MNAARAASRRRPLGRSRAMIAGRIGAEDVEIRPKNDFGLVRLLGRRDADAQISQPRIHAQYRRHIGAARSGRLRPWTLNNNLTRHP